MTPKAAALLEDAGFNLAKSKKNTELVAILSSNQPLSQKISQILSDNSINIEYAYSVVLHVNGGVAWMLRVSDTLKAETPLKANNVKVLTLEEIKPSRLSKN